MAGDRVTCARARYIKLGAKGSWESLCLGEGTLRLGYYEASHAAALAGDKDALKRCYEELGNGAPADSARQVLQFYDPSPDTLWFTFSDGFLWWCKAQPEVTYLGDNRQQLPYGSRLRHAVGGWSKCNIQGEPLRILDLAGELSKTAAYRKTICDIKPHLVEYLLRKINGETLPQIIEVQESLAQLQQALWHMITMLHWRDFELLVELIFSHSGWQRISVVGEQLKTTDIELLLPVTGERAMVQIKSETNQRQLDEYVKAFSRWEISRLFYVYHSSTDAFALDVGDPRVTLMGPAQLASMVIKAGLIEWLVGKVG